MRHERSGRVAARQFGVSPSLPLHGGQSGLVCIWAPYEGKSVTPNRAGNLARRDVPTCSLSDSAAPVRQQLRKNGAKLCAVHRAAELGKMAAMTENRTLGGTCVNRGCLPSKNLIAAALARSANWRKGSPGATRVQ